MGANVYLASGSSGTRPDADGYLTFREARNWYRQASGQRLTVDLNKLDFSLASFKFTKRGDLEADFGAGGLFTNESLVHGRILLQRQTDGSWMLKPSGKPGLEGERADWYDFNYDKTRGKIGNFINACGYIVNSFAYGCIF